MDINFNRYKVETEKDENSCSLRYKLSGETLGVLRYSYQLGVGKRVKQNIIILREWDVNKLLGEIVYDGGYSPELGETIIKEIKDRSYDIISKYVSRSLKR